ncbi:ATPase inhibitor mai-1, mitochondrial isoform X1 [Octopus bimaculoides]|nr:ATPase inhibitor mai-1, mitochondrial isoform X1 [Octopus bimaculoides]|eukprot:XP_014774521.1 PREDICTED: ATPase inhibitor mai-1, mitochondrial-like isoform X1 [Octopus bimaculoides]
MFWIVSSSGSRIYLEHLNCVMDERGINGLSECVRYSSELGSGSGKGGGSGGSIREAGGAFGKMEAAREEEFFKRLEKQQLAMLKKQIHEDIDFHESQIKIHEEAIKRHKKKIKGMKSDSD